MKQQHEPSDLAPEQDKRTKLLQEIAEDAHQEPERYAESCLVPEGGE